jgi:hypothetical protein
MRFAILSLLALSLAGCGHEATPTNPSAAASALRSDAAVSPFAQNKLDDLWPNDNLHAWSFSYRSEESLAAGPTIYPTAAQVPAAPSPEEVLPALHMPFTGSNVHNGDYTLIFDGQTTTASGATGQNLRETLVLRGTALVPTTVPDLRQRLMARVARARPDLRRRIVALGDYTRVADTLTTYPLLVHGGCWEKTLDHIGTYGDLDRQLAWKFLDADTKQGASFRMQLLPSITTDVFLTGWVVPRKERGADAKGKALEVVYVIDYGVSQALDQSGGVIGYFRAIGYGSVIYVPGQGPVSSLERTLAWVEHPEQPIAQITITPQDVAVVAQ